MKGLIPLAALTMLGLTACGNTDSTTVGADGNTVTPVVVTDAICRPTANGRKVTACYLHLVSTRDDTLESVATPAAARASIHETTMESNMMMMHPIEGGVPMTAGQPVVFTPGGNHIMLNDVAEPLVAGDTVELTLSFAQAPDLTVTAAVGQPPASNEG
ncbi:copper chaperone PCu(A)C [Brevundimonas subvibrioides]|uniref:copper chaperone PCu(A)C n=1 Tax=Brevundimonas subvibrioides TaxID=74313 RepID=UPI0022B44FBF|nr:copper chaperone PCu(A)C [Brevundimonas subvibrioides]